MYKTIECAEVISVIKKTYVRIFQKLGRTPQLNEETPLCHQGAVNFP